MNQTQNDIQTLNRMLCGYWVAQAIYVAAELGVADVLADGPRTVEQLAEKADADPQALYRVLRALASAGIFAEDAQRRFTLTPLAQRLRLDVEESQRSVAIMMGAEFYETWGQLLHTVRTGQRGFDARYGASFFEYMTRHPERHRIYDAAMNGIHDPETQPMLDAYDFSGFRTVADIGGGNGLTLAAVLKRHPAVKGILFDLPAVAESARPVFARLGLSDRCEIVSGDFFSSVPAADAYVLRHVIHDWPDEEATVILRNCASAMPPNGRILVIENIITPPNQDGFGKWLDLMMLLVGGRERTQEQYAELLARAGLTLNRIVTTAASVSVIEARVKA